MAAQDKNSEALRDARSQAKSWQAEGEAYVRDNSTQAVLIALGVGLLLGLYASSEPSLLDSIRDFALSLFVTQNCGCNS